MRPSNDRTLSARSIGRRREDHVHARLAALVHSSADAIIGETLDGIITDWNPAAERLYGYTAGEVIGQHRTMLIPPHEARAVEAMAARVQRGEDIAEVETVRWAKDGRRIEVALTVSPLKSHTGELIGASVVVRDITARKATERALAASENLFRVAFANAPVGMVLATPDMHTVRVNRALCDMLGYTEDELLTMDHCAFTHAADIAANQAFMEHAIAGELDTYELEKRYLHKDGHVVWGHLRGSLVRDEAGAPLYFISQILDITQRKAAADALAASEERFRVAFEDAPIGMAIVRPDLGVLRVNRRSCEILGYPEDEILGTTFLALTHPDDRDGNTDLIARALAGELRTFELEKRYIRKDGQIVWTLLCASLIRDADGTPRYFISQLQDITERRQLLDELQASEAKYRTLVEQLPEVVYLLAADEAQTPLYVSPRHEALTGYRLEEAASRTEQWLQRVHPEDRKRVVAEVARTTAADRPFHMIYRYVRSDGRVIWVEDSYDAVRNDAGTIVAWLGTLLDVTDRVTAEEDQARLAAIVESAEDAVVSSTIAGTITSWNDGAERLYGYRAEEALGQSFTILLPDDLNDPTPEVRRAALSGMPVAPFESTRRRHDGTIFPASIALSPIRDRAGRIIGISSITRDITARQQLELELRAALEAAQAGIRTKSLFLAMMSHELRTPLQAVLGYADFLFNGPPGSLTAEQRDDIGYIRQGAGRMVTLIEQLLDLSRMEAGRLELASEPVALETILEQVRQDIGPLVTAKALEFSIDVPANMPPVLGDAVRLRQILLNLVGNAVKFTEAGSVAVTATQTADGIAVVVRDTGIGISQEALPFIFEEFRQVDGNLTRRYGGAGLGLAIARKLAEQMGGDITGESAIGVGSTFILRLPAAPLKRPPSQK